MSLAKSSTFEVQQLVRMLRIDPDNVTVSAPGEDQAKDHRMVGQQRLVQSKITSLMRASAKMKAENRPMPLRAKRKASAEANKGASPAPGEGAETVKKIRGRACTSTSRYINVGKACS